MSAYFTHFAWTVSPYSAKTRAYLTFKRIPFTEVAPSAWTLYRDIQKAVGAAIMPTVLTPEGRWMQDSTEIIDALEERFPKVSVHPSTPKQRIAALLLELHADEWLPSVALHYRWNRHENRDFALREFGSAAFPGLPPALSRVLVRPVASKMAGYRAVVGVTHETIPGFERFTASLLAQLELHLRAYPFLFGTRPSVADFALYGPLWAHLYRDPGSTYLFRDTPHIVAWFERLMSPLGRDGAFLPDDEVPATLEPVLATLFAEQMPFVMALMDAIDVWCDAHPEATRVPRALGDHAFTVGGSSGRRRLLTYTQWMAQRPLAAYATLSATDRPAVDAWLRRLGGDAARDAIARTVRHPLERHAFKLRLATRTPALASALTAGEPAAR
ncbi:MAG: glutathione S-transferase family protein [Sandaracinaceae bacterium]|nr:glutathione S-transferase family protein [Sandaracinaceae bacterium]